MLEGETSARTDCLIFVQAVLKMSAQRFYEEDSENKIKNIYPFDMQDIRKTKKSSHNI